MQILQTKIQTRKSPKSMVNRHLFEAVLNGDEVGVSLDPDYLKKVLKLEDVEE